MTLEALRTDVLTTVAVPFLLELALVEVEGKADLTSRLIGGAAIEAFWQLSGSTFASGLVILLGSLVSVLAFALALLAFVGRVVATALRS